MAQKWVYFEVTMRGSDTEWRRAARFLAGQYLHRQIFDVERVVYTPQNLTPAKRLNDVQYYFQGAIAAVPAETVVQE